jgi:methyl-accepting chemotaxis protein
MIGQAVTTSNNEIILALIALIATSIGALVFVIKNGKLVKDTNDQVSQVNTAVNHVESGEQRLYDKVSHLVSELEDVKDILNDVTVEIKQHRLFWDQLHKITHKETKVAEDSIVKTLQEIRNDVIKVKEKIEVLDKERT